MPVLIMDYRERPIMFSGEMVRAILDGRKTQTRRVIATDTRPQSADTFMRGFPPNPVNVRNGFGYAKCDAPPGSRSVSYRVPWPYGDIGDRLWVRETFAFYPKTFYGDKVLYRAVSEQWALPWKPSIFMPRRASRITLEITMVRVERVQEISEEDAIAEGVRMNNSTHWETEARESFRRLWDSLNAKRGFGWDKNPWVWVIEFKKL